MNFNVNEPVRNGGWVNDPRINNGPEAKYTTDNPLGAIRVTPRMGIVDMVDNQTKSLVILINTIQELEQALNPILREVDLEETKQSETEGIRVEGSPYKLIDLLEKNARKIENISFLLRRILNGVSL